MSRSVRVRRVLTAAALATLLVVPRPAGAADSSDPIVFGDDVPTRRPVLTWEVPVRCPVDGCTVSVAGDTAVVVAAGKPSEITAVEVRSGTARWRRALPAAVDQPVLIGRLLVLLGTAGAVVLDAGTGDTVATADAPIVAVIRAGVLLADDGTTISGIDAATGKPLWTRRGNVRLVNACRGVVLLAGRTSDQGIEAIDQRTGALRWRSTHRLAPELGDAICNLAWLYVANGSSVAEIDLATGYRNWQTPIDQLQSFTLLDSGTGIALAGDDAIGIDLWAGEVIWQRRVDDIGALAGGPAWLRTSGGELFKLLPWSGERSAAVDPFASLDRDGIPDGADDSVGAAPGFNIVHTSETRVLLRRERTVVALGLSDLGMSWSLELPTEPTWTGVAAGSLLVIDDDSLDGYRPAPLTVE